MSIMSTKNIQNNATDSYNTENLKYIFSGKFWTNFMKKTLRINMKVSSKKPAALHSSSAFPLE